MKRASRLLMIAGMLFLVADQAQAQMLKWEDRGFLNAGYAFQSKGAKDINTSSTFSLYDETAQVSSTQSVESSGGTLDFGAGVRLYGNMGVGVGFTTLSKDATGNVTAKVPHPLFYDQPRTATASVSGLAHKETAFHVSALYVFPLSGKFDVTLSAGPSFFSIEQDTLSSPQVGQDVAPYTTVTLANVTRVSTKKSTVGFNAGLDGTYRFAKHVGLGVFARYTSGSTDVTPTGSSQSVKLEAGGIQFGAGLRLRF